VLQALIEDEGVTLTPEEQEVQDLLEKLYPPVIAEAVDGDEAQRMAVEAAASLDETDRARLVERLAWFGELALVPRGSDAAAREAVIGPVRIVAMIVVLLALMLCAAAVLGFAALIAMSVLAATGRLTSGMGPPRPHHGVYAETFAVWLAIFLALQVGGSVLPGPVMIITAVSFFLSLFALGWPVLRGVPWSQVRRDVGLTMGRAPVVEPLIGIAAYAATLPLLAVGLLLTLILMTIQTAMHTGEVSPFSPTGAPAHPVIFELTGDKLWPKLQVLFLAAVAAPIVEETMFRGVLYRHTRDMALMRGLGLGLSIAAGSTVVAFLFAVIHPQGWVAIPALMSLAYGMTLVREWRGSLVPSMVVHGVSNGLVMMLLILLLGA
jgi:membrane protease YdiL (CAAX protease family)